jgi:hypothetical protein
MAQPVSQPVVYANGLMFLGKWSLFVVTLMQNTQIEEHFGVQKLVQWAVDS